METPVVAWVYRENPWYTPWVYLAKNGWTVKDDDDSGYVSIRRENGAYCFLKEKVTAIYDPKDIPWDGSVE